MIQPEPMQAWVPFYTVIAQAAATLLGLLFVAVSITGDGDFVHPRSPTRALAEQAFQNYLAVLIIACIMLFPDESLVTVGIGGLAVVAVKTLWALVRLVQSVRRGTGDMPLLATVRRHAISIVGLGLLLYATIRLATGHRDSFHALASGALTLLASSATVSWELMHHLLRQRGRQGE